MKRYDRLKIIGLFILSGSCGLVLSYFMPAFQSYYAPTPLHLRDAQVTHTPVSFVAQIKGDPDAGRKIFKEFCAACHAALPLVEIDAPRINDKAAWKKRAKSGLPTLLKTTIEGIGAMPSRGGCFECSDEQLKESIDYLLHQASISQSN